MLIVQDNINYLAVSPLQADVDGAAADTALGGEHVLVREEEKEVGVVAFTVYRAYWSAVGNILAPVILLALFLMQGVWVWVGGGGGGVILLTLFHMQCVLVCKCVSGCVCIYQCMVAMYITNRHGNHTLPHIRSFSFTCLCMHAASRNVSDWWLAYWISHSNIPSNFGTNISAYNITNVTHSSSTPEHIPPLPIVSASDNLAFYLGIYGGLAAANSVSRRDNGKNSPTSIG